MPKEIPTVVLEDLQPYIDDLEDDAEAELSNGKEDGNDLQ